MQTRLLRKQQKQQNSKQASVAVAKDVVVAVLVVAVAVVAVVAAADEAGLAKVMRGGAAHVGAVEGTQVDGEVTTRMPTHLLLVLLRRCTRAVMQLARSGIGLSKRMAEELLIRGRLPGSFQ